MLFCLNLYTKPTDSKLLLDIVRYENGMPDGATGNIVNILADRPCSKGKNIVIFTQEPLNPQ